MIVPLITALLTVFIVQPVYRLKDHNLVYVIVKYSHLIITYEFLANVSGLYVIHVQFAIYLKFSLLKPALFLLIKFCVQATRPHNQITSF